MKNSLKLFAIAILSIPLSISYTVGFAATMCVRSFRSGSNGFDKFINWISAE